MRSTQMVVISSLCLASTLPAQANLLYNGGFDIVGPSGTTTTYTGLFAGPSAADGWEVFNNSNATTRTQLLPTTLNLPGASPNMIHVATTGINCGLDELFLPPNTGPTNATFSVWLYVQRGTVGVGLGNGGNTGLSSFNTTHGQWELITGFNAASPANNFIIYSASVDGAEWYAEMADVTPAPATALLAPLSAACAFRRRRA